MANLKISGRPVQGGTPAKEFKAGDYAVNPFEQKLTLQADAILDLSDNTDTVTIVPEALIPAEYGGDVIVPTRIWAYVVTDVTGTPVITLEAADGTDTGLALTLGTSDDAGDITFAEVTDSLAMTAVDNSTDALVASCTTAGGGTVKVVVEFLLIK
jgi:hypothetical protein